MTGCLINISTQVCVVIVYGSSIQDNFSSQRPGPGGGGHSLYNVATYEHPPDIAFQTIQIS